MYTRRLWTGIIVTVRKTPNFTWISVINTPNKSNKLNFKGTEFLQSASALTNAPPDLGCEVAFAGRSNAGKSSAINALTDNTKLARTSRTPGRTQLINFFTVAENRRLVDLPGYGFAKVPLKIKQEWNKQLEQYLQYRQSLKGLILLMDIRHPLKDYDRQMIEWAAISEMPVHILLTKCDKLKRGPAKTALLTVQKALKPHERWISVQLFSSHSHDGMSELQRTLNWWLTLPDDDISLLENSDESLDTSAGSDAKESSGLNESSDLDKSSDLNESSDANEDSDAEPKTRAQISYES